MLLFAVSALDKASKIPGSFWVKLVCGILGFFLAVVLLRKLFEVNKVILAAVCFIAAGTMGFSWIYHRNEPEFLTPVVDRIAPFFPAKGGYEIRQAEEPGGQKKATTKQPAKAPPRKAGG